MSPTPTPDPIAEQPASASPVRRTLPAWVVLAVLAGLLAAAAGLALFGLQLQRAEAGELVGELFEDGERLPLGLVYDSAVSNANQQRSVRWRLDPEAPAQEPAAPEDLTVVRYAGPMPVQRHFRPATLAGRQLAERVDAWREDPRKAFDAQLERGTLRFGRWESDWTRSRLYGRDGAFRDVVSVNISIGDRPQVLFARWPENSEAARAETLLPVLRELRLDALWQDYESRREGARRGKDAASMAPEPEPETEPEPEPAAGAAGGD